MKVYLILLIFLTLLISGCVDFSEPVNLEDGINSVSEAKSAFDQGYSFRCDYNLEPFNIILIFNPDSKMEYIYDFSEEVESFIYTDFYEDKIELYSWGDIHLGRDGVYLPLNEGEGYLTRIFLDELPLKDMIYAVLDEYKDLIEESDCHLIEYKGFEYPPEDIEFKIVSGVE
jgi:hypothetical protein